MLGCVPTMDGPIRLHLLRVNRYGVEVGELFTILHSLNQSKRLLKRTNRIPFNMEHTFEATKIGPLFCWLHWSFQ